MTPQADFFTQTGCEDAFKFSILNRSIQSYKQRMTNEIRIGKKGVGEVRSPRRQDGYFIGIGKRVTNQERTG